MVHVDAASLLQPCTTCAMAIHTYRLLLPEHAVQGIFSAAPAGQVGCCCALVVVLAVQLEDVLRSSLVLIDVDIPLVALSDGVHARSFAGNGIIVHHGEKVSSTTAALL